MNYLGGCQGNCSLLGKITNFYILFLTYYVRGQNVCLNPLGLIQGVPQNSLRFSIGNFLGHDALWIFILDIFQQLFKIVHDFKDYVIFEKVIKEILTKTQNKYQQIRKEFKK